MHEATAGDGHPGSRRDPTAARGPRTGVVIALKDLETAKSRLTPLAPAVRQRLALLMLAATAGAWSGPELVVVTSTPAIAGFLRHHGVRSRTLPDPGSGLNPAFERGAAALLTAGCDRVIACMADLPALRPESVARVLAPTTSPGRWFVADATGRGTTMLIATGTELRPAFGAGSASRHAGSGAAALELGPDARTDVDGLADLATALELGVRPPADALGDAGGDHHTATVRAADTSGVRLILDSGLAAQAEPTAVGREIGTLRPGQRVHLLSQQDRIRHLWI